MSTDYQHWLLHKENHIATLTLNRPKEKNRIGTITLQELSTITEVIKNDADIWLVVLASKGDSFSAGVDVSLIGNLIGKNYETFSQNLKSSQEILDRFEALEKPVIAALHGHVVGGGLILALCCDFRIAAENTIVSLPEVKRSIGVIMGTQRITNTIGIAHTKELVMLGNQVSSDRAFQMGLFHKLVPTDQLDNEVKILAQQILQLPPLAVGLCKKIINEGQHLERNGQDLEIDAQSKLLDTQDFKEAIASFFEKRKPVFMGK